MFEFTKLFCICMLAGVDDEAGDFTGLCINTYWTQEQILHGDFKELATGISDVCIQIDLNELFSL